MVEDTILVATALTKDATLAVTSGSTKTQLFEASPGFS